MVCCSSTGIAFAIGPHCFYNHKNDQIADNTSHQQRVCRAGTAAAFIVKLSLTTATSALYLHWLWRHMERNPSKLEPPLLAFSAIATCLAKPHKLLPLAIFTLGTIVVQPSVATTQQIIAIPNGDSIHEDFSGPFTAANSNPTVFGGTLANGSLAFFSTLVQGEVVQILQDNYIANIIFLGIVSQENIVPNMNGSFFNLSAGLFGKVLLNTFSKDFAKIFFRVSQDDSSKLIECFTYNATYTATFDLPSNGQQNVSAKLKCQNYRDTTHGGVISIVALSSSSQTKYYADFSDEPGHPTGLAGLMSGIESLMQNFTLSGHFGAVTALNDVATGYGLSVFGALSCILLDVVALRHSQASYMNSFSMVHRVTMNLVVDPLNSDGKNQSGANRYGNRLQKRW
ncbi:hypothetical protein K432DRAFT_431067 [Lepidopterella palustris CBS 459.81]|uniref:Uncharacterized protein n=1 Tax=Lepidopterella palustris CBS 459.81 TaxID=1314670 RepID=A0A8E2EM96_9PEZI|nr:hypothetical protein K432DRAFT_431067 [Lepidopterella palustris CBS 459.81]